MNAYETFTKASKNKQVGFDNIIPPGMTDNTQIGQTWNGDFNYTSLGKDVFSQILGFKQKLVNDFVEQMPKSRGKASKRKKQTGLPKDSVMNIPIRMQKQIEKEFNHIMVTIKSKSEKEITLYLDIMFRVIFHERAIPRDGQGKGQRSISFLLWHLMYKEMPQTSLELLSLFPQYGRFRDLDNIMNHYIVEKDGNITFTDEKVINYCMDVYFQYLDADYKTIFGKNMNEHSHSILRKNIDCLHQSLFGKNQTDEFRKKISLCAKFIGREHHKFEFIRFGIISRMFFNGDVQKLSQKVSTSRGFYKFAQATLRKLLSSFNEIIGVVESKMSTHRWDEIEPSKVTSGATSLYRYAFLNQKLDTIIHSSMIDTGNRSREPSRIDLRKRTLQSALDGALNGAALDSIKLGRIIFDKVKTNNPMSGAERQIIHSQFIALVDSIKENIESICAEREDSINPFDIIATIDVSGSMESANVIHGAVMLGIIVTKLSSFTNSFITFSEKPQIVQIDFEKGDIIDWFRQTLHSNWGGSTDIDKANKLIASLMNKYKMENPTFDAQVNHIIFTDGQFNPTFVRGWFNSSNQYYYQETKLDSGKWNTAVERMKSYFTQYGLSIPNTIFWNMNRKSPGFPTTGDMEGFQLAEGISHGMLTSILTNVMEYTVNKDGEKIARINPVKSFQETIYHPYFDNITKIVHHIGEGVFKTEDNRLYSAQYMKKFC
jgi:hypothetical protein